MQGSILQWVSRTVDARQRTVNGKKKFVDFFCGVGGASVGAEAAGFDVVLAIDACSEVLDLHKKNNRRCEHICTELPTRLTLPLPGADEDWHLHGSPPCTKVSKANQQRLPEEREKGKQLVKWYMTFAMDSSAASWSMEQVASPPVLEAMSELKAPHSTYRKRFSFVILDLYDLGVPQHRRRLLAGPVELIAAVQRARKIHRSVRDVIPRCRGTHVRNEVYHSGPTRKRRNGLICKFRSYGPDDCCVPVDGPGYTITARHTLRWASPGTGAKLIRMTPRETASMQTFPETFQLADCVRVNQRGLGNALPPIVMQRLLQIGNAVPPCAAEIMLRGEDALLARPVLDLAEGMRVGSPSLR
jgi:DNA (cytosine-5)-methyltransferase 1